MKNLTVIAVADECIQYPDISLKSESRGRACFLAHHVAHVLVGHHVLVEDNFVALLYEVGYGP